MPGGRGSGGSFDRMSSQMQPGADPAEAEASRQSRGQRALKIAGLTGGSNREEDMQAWPDAKPGRVLSREEEEQKLKEFDDFWNSA